MKPRYERERSEAIDAVRQATWLCQSVRAALKPEVLDKKDKSPVTVADFGSQAVICRALGITFPDDPIIAEEDAAELTEPKNAAILDELVAQVRASGSIRIAKPRRPRFAIGSTGAEARVIATVSGQLIQSMAPRVSSATSSTPWHWR